jgi:hypothetical protein
MCTCRTLCVIKLKPLNTIGDIRKYFILLLLIFGSCENEPSPKQGNLELPCNHTNDVIQDTIYLTWEDIYKVGITTLVGKTIVVKSKLHWNTGWGYYDAIPEINPAGKIQTLFEYPDSFNSKLIFRSDDRGDLFLVSNKIEKYTSFREKQEKYALDCEELSNGGCYYLIQGKLEYRLKVDAEILNNPKFIAQSNNVVYWSQTFQFNSEKICVLK